MGDSIRSSNRKSTIQHTRQERHPAGPPRNVLPIRPHEAITRMLLRHRGHHNNCNQPAANNQEQAHILQVRYNAIVKDDNRAAPPRDNEKCDIDVPGLDDKVWVEDSVHLDGSIGDDLDN